MTAAGRFRWTWMGIVAAAIAASISANDGTAAAAPPPVSQAQKPPAKPNDRCPLTVEQVAAVTGVPMTPTGACTFFPANGRDIPHVFYVQQVPMVCNSIQPADLGFKEKVEGLPARAAYIKDALDGAHLLVCRDNNLPAFDIVVEIRNDKAKNREAAMTLAKQVLGAR